MGKCSMGRKPKWTEKDLKKLQKKQSKNARKHSRTRRKVATVAGETVAPNARGVYAGRRKDVGQQNRQASSRWFVFAIQMGS